MRPKTEDRRRQYSHPLIVLRLRLLFVFAVVIFLALAAFSLAVMGAEPLPGPVIPDGFGVNFHFTDTSRMV